MVASVLEGIFNANPNPTSRPLTLRELLDRTIVRVRKQVNDPASRAEREHTIAGAYVSLGAYEKALAIYHRSPRACVSCPAKPNRRA